MSEIRDTQISADAQCPFFNAAFDYKDGRVMISCEQAGEGIKNTIQEFANKKSMKAYAGRYCCEAWDKCPMARLLNGKYES